MELLKKKKEFGTTLASNPICLTKINYLETKERSKRRGFLLVHAKVVEVWIDILRF